MRLERLAVVREVQRGTGTAGTVLQGDAQVLMPELIEQHAGSVQLVYLDPPFATGKQFNMKMRVGEKEHQSGNGSLTLCAYNDAAAEADYLSMMRTVLEGARTLLSNEGSVFLHIDYRMNAKLRLLMDEVFGADNFVNEIVWVYQTGGRASRHFSRKHDIILFYRKTRRNFFDLKPVAISREGARRNHMKRHVDADGRVYRSIKSGVKVYTYYDDEPTYPTDVWEDVSHLQQKDPQRTGYDTQKPLSLLERIILCASRPGDLVCDLFAGSGTTLLAAHRLGRRFLGVDRGQLALHVMRRRLADANVNYVLNPSVGEPGVRARCDVGVGFYEIELLAYELEAGLIARTLLGMDALDGWAVGYLRDGEFVEMARAQRSKAEPAPPLLLQLPVLDGVPMIRTSDVLGRTFHYAIEERDGDSRR